MVAKSPMKMGTPVVAVSKQNPRHHVPGVPDSSRLDRGTDYLAMSFSAFIGRTLITLRAGLALNICSCFVKGLIPL